MKSGRGEWEWRVGEESGRGEWERRVGGETGRGEWEEAGRWDNRDIGRVGEVGKEQAASERGGDNS